VPRDSGQTTAILEGCHGGPKQKTAQSRFRCRLRAGSKGFLSDVPASAFLLRSRSSKAVGRIDEFSKSGKAPDWVSQSVRSLSAKRLICSIRPKPERLGSSVPFARLNILNCSVAKLQRRKVTRRENCAKRPQKFTDSLLRVRP